MPLWKTDNVVHAGKIIKAHGYLGAFKVAFFMPVNQEKLLKNSFLFIEWNEKHVPYLIEEIQWQNNELAIIKVADVNNEKQAAALQNLHICLFEKMVADEDENEPEFAELIGFKVLDENKNDLGKVTDVFESGPQFLIEVSKAEKSFLVPVHEDLITKINRSKKQLFVELPEGLTDL